MHEYDAMYFYDYDIMFLHDDDGLVMKGHSYTISNERITWLYKG